MKKYPSSRRVGWALPTTGLLSHLGIGAADKFDMLTSTLPSTLRAVLHHPTADWHRRHTYTAKRYTHDRTNRPAIVVIQVIRATNPELAVQLVGDAHPTRLWMAPLWPAHEAQSGPASSTKFEIMSKLQGAVREPPPTGQTSNP